MSKDFQAKGIPYKSYSIPGKVEFVDYDLGSLGVGYYDRDFIDDRSDGGNTNSYKAWNKGYRYRNDGVDIEIGGDGFYVSHTESGEFLKYTVNVIKSDRYDVLVTTSSSSIEAELSLQVQSNRVKFTIEYPYLQRASMEFGKNTI